MNVRLALLGLAVALLFGLAGYAAGAADLFGSESAPVSDGMPVPGVDGVEETIVDSGMPVPGMDGVEEAIVGSQMPVPGLEGVEEMIVHDD